MKLLVAGIIVVVVVFAALVGIVWFLGDPDNYR